MAKVKKPRILESTVQKAIFEYLSYLKGGKFWRNNTTGVYDARNKRFRTLLGPGDPKGSPDIVGVYKNRFVGIEVKSPNNRLRPNHQKEFLNAITRNGGFAIFANCVTDVKTLIKEIDLM